MFSKTVISAFPLPASPCSSLRANLCIVGPPPPHHFLLSSLFPFLTITSSWLEEAYFMFNLKWVRSDVSGCQVKSSGNLKLILILRLYVKFNEQNLQGRTWDYAKEKNSWMFPVHRHIWELLGKKQSCNSHKMLWVIILLAGKNKKLKFLLERKF